MKTSTMRSFFVSLKWMKNYYSILGLSPGASKDAIKKAYRSLAMKWHPDKNASSEAKQKFIIYTEAYDALMAGKSFSSFIKTSQRNGFQKAKPKTPDELRRERMQRNHDLLRKKFMDIREKLIQPNVIDKNKSKMYGTINFYFMSSAVIVSGSIAMPFILGNPGLMVPLFPIGLALSIRVFWHAGRKKMKADMLFSNEENYSLEELRDFFGREK